MARLIYTEEQIAYVREIAPGTFNREIAALFNERFDTNITAKKITALKRNHNITSGTRGKGPGKNPHLENRKMTELPVFGASILGQHTQLPHPPRKDHPWKKRNLTRRQY